MTIPVAPLHNADQRPADNSEKSKAVEHGTSFLTTCVSWIDRRRPLVCLGSLLLGAPFCWMLASHLATQWHTTRVNVILQNARIALEARQKTVGLELQRELSALRTVPQVLATDVALKALLRVPGATREAAAVNEILLRATRLRLADVVWLMDPSGVCVAASNSATPESLVGQRYSDRSYFTEAMGGAIGSQYATGRKTRIPGLFYSAPVRDAGDANGGVIGVIAAKADLPSLSPRISLRGGMLLDDLDVVVMADDGNALGQVLPDARVLKLAADDVNNRYQQMRFQQLPLAKSNWPQIPGVESLSGQPVVTRRDAMPGSGFTLLSVEPVPGVLSAIDDASRARLYGFVAGLVLIGALLAAALAAARAHVFSLRLEGRNRQLAALNDELLHVSQTDALTGCMNQRHLMSVLTSEIKRSQRHQRPLCVAMLDIDSFKSINDTHGHAVGNDALIHVVGLLTSAIRDTDFVGRLGGDELALLLVDLDGPNCAPLLDRIRAKVEAHPLTLTSEKNRLITVSMGFTLIRDGDDAEAMLRRADQALYAAKAAGRNRVVSADAMPLQ